MSHSPSGASVLPSAFSSPAASTPVANALGSQLATHILDPSETLGARYRLQTVHRPYARSEPRLTIVRVAARPRMGQPSRRSKGELVVVISELANRSTPVGKCRTRGKCESPRLVGHRCARRLCVRADLRPLALGSDRLSGEQRSAPRSPSRRLSRSHTGGIEP